MKPHGSITPEQAASSAAALAQRIAADQSLIEIQRKRAALPVDEFKPAILEAVKHSQVVLVAGATGCGKTTQVPQYLIDDAWANGKGAAIMCTQPRRISAVTVSERVANERGEQIGAGSVGYQIRLETKSSAECALMFCTNGVLLRRLTSPGADKMLESLVAHRHRRAARARPFCRFSDDRPSRGLAKAPALTSGADVRDGPRGPVQRVLRWVPRHQGAGIHPPGGGLPPRGYTESGSGTAAAAAAGSTTLSTPPPRTRTDRRGRPRRPR